MSVTGQQVVSLLENVLFESSTLATANAASWESNSAATSIAGLAAAMAASPEETIAAHIVGYYLSALGRAPTAAELQFYVSYAEKGLTQTQIAAGQVAASTWDNVAGFFTSSPEFAIRAGIDNSLGPAAALLEAVPWLFESVLGRAPSDAEISFYDNAVVSGAGLNTLLGYFTSSKEFATDTASQIQTALATYGADVASGQEPAAVGASVTLGPPPPPPPPPPPSTVFTTGTDHFSATEGSLVYTATLGGVSPTLTTNDSLHGAGNTLNITDTSGGASQDLMPSGVSLTGIATITLTTSGNAGTGQNTSFDLSGVTGLTSFTLNSSGGQVDFLNTGSATSVTVNVSGTGRALFIGSNSLATLTLSGAITGGILLDNPSGPTSLTLAVNGLTQLNQFGDSDHLTSLTIAGSGAASDISSLSCFALTSLTLSGPVTLGSAAFPAALFGDSTTISAAGDTAPISISTEAFGITGTIGAAGAGVSGNHFTLNDANDVVELNSQPGNGGSGGSVTGSLDNAAGGNGGSGGSAGNDTVILGNGNDTVTINSIGGIGGDGGSASTDSSNGSSAIGGTGGSGGNSTGDVIVAGNGNNVITDNSRGGDGGSGGNASIGTSDTSLTHTAEGGNGGASGTSGNDIIAVGTGNNTINLGGHGNDTVIVDTDGAYNAANLTANQTLTGASGGVTLEFRNDAAPGTGTVPAILTSLTPVSLDTSSHGTASLQAYLQDAEASITAAGGAGNLVTSFTFGGNTYLLENNGSTIFDAGHTAIVEIMGMPAVSINAGTGHITLT